VCWAPPMLPAGSTAANRSLGCVSSQNRACAQRIQHPRPRPYLRRMPRRSKGDPVTVNAGAGLDHQRDYRRCPAPLVPSGFLRSLALSWPSSCAAAGQLRSLLNNGGATQPHAVGIDGTTTNPCCGDFTHGFPVFERQMADRRSQGRCHATSPLRSHRCKQRATGDPHLAASATAPPVNSRPSQHAPGFVILVPRTEAVSPHRGAIDGEPHPLPPLLQHHPRPANLQPSRRRGYETKALAPITRSTG